MTHMAEGGRTTTAAAGDPACTRVKRGVIGILRDRGRYLLVRRAPGVRRGGHWCFPGGHLEPGENARQAVRRELLEELGVEVWPAQRLGAVRIGHEYVLAVWLVTHDGKPLRLALEEVDDARWVTLDELPGVTPGLDSNRFVLDMLRRLDDQSGGNGVCCTPSGG